MCVCIYSEKKRESVSACASSSGTRYSYVLSECVNIYIYTEREREREGYKERESVCVPATYHQAHTHILNIHIHKNTSKTYEHRYTMLIRLACAAIGPPAPRVPCRASRQTYTARRWSTGLEDHKGVESCRRQQITR